MTGGPLTATEIATAVNRHAERSARIGARKPFGRREIENAVLDHRLAVAAEVRFQQVVMSNG